MTSPELQAIAAAGGGLILDAAKYSGVDLQAIARKVTSLLTLKNAAKLTAAECQAIAKQNPGRVVFDLT